MNKPSLHRFNLSKTRAAVPPWILIGSFMVLTPIFLFLTFENIHRQKQNTIKLLVEKGAALIRSFEAGARMGMRGMMGMRRGDFQLQRLLTETAKQPDIVYIIVTDAKGRIKAHNNLSQVGKRYGTDLDLEKIQQSGALYKREVINETGQDTFEVFRNFKPLQVGMHRHLKRHLELMDKDLRRRFERYITGEIKQIIFVGFDMGPFKTAREEETLQIVITTALLLLAGLGGIFFLFLTQAYQTAKTSLSRVKALSDKLVENMPIGLISLDRNQKIVTFNNSSQSILHKPFKEAHGKEAKDVLPVQFHSLIERISNKEEQIAQEMLTRLANGKEISLDIIIALLKDEAGEMTGYLILFKDLTEIKGLKKEIETSRRLASIGRLAAGVAHEIRNPLSSIKGFATYFKERYAEVREDKKTAEIMIEEVERLNRVVSQLLEFARPLELRKEDVNIKRLIEHSLKMIEMEVKQRNIELEINSQMDKSEVVMDKDKMEQVLLNLYLNALDSMEEKGGKLSVEVNNESFNGKLRFVVSDNGSGIKEEDTPHLFDPYFTTKQSGTGLGLAIVRKIVEAHGGDIKIESSSEKGTVVTVSIPLNQEGGSL